MINFRRLSQQEDRHPLECNSDAALTELEPALDLWKEAMHSTAGNLPFTQGCEVLQSHGLHGVKLHRGLELEIAQCLWGEVLMRFENGEFQEAHDKMGIAEMRRQIRHPRLLNACAAGYAMTWTSLMKRLPLTWNGRPSSLMPA